MKTGQRVTVVADSVFHGLEIGSTHVIDDIIQWKSGNKSATIGRYYVPFSDIKEADDNVLET